MNLDVRPLSDVLGAEVAGLDARRPLSEKMESALRQALHLYQVLTIREQQLTPRQFVDFARVFGELEPFFSSAYSLPDCPEIYVLSNARRCSMRSPSRRPWATPSSPICIAPMRSCRTR